MQIFPTDRSASPSAFFSGMDYSGQSGSDFLSAMESALDSVRDGYNVSATSALNDETSQPLVESPYTRHSDDGVTYTLEEVTFTKSELEELREQLLKEGAPEESLRQFDVLAGQPDGATLAQVMASLIGKSGNNFSDEDAHAITSLLNKIDPSGTLATDAIAMMRDGNGAGALDLIRGALGKLGPDEGIEFSMAELLALGRGLGLNADAMRGLAGNMGGNDSLILNAAQFDALMNPAKNFFLEQAANADKLDAALEKTIKPLISKARDRMEKEKAAGELQNRRVEQSRVLIDDTVQEKARQAIDDTATGENRHAERGEAGAEKARAGKASADGKEAAFAQGARNFRTAQTDMAEKASNAKGAANDNADPRAQMEARLYQKEGKGGQQFNERDNQGKSDVWQDMLGKVETKPIIQAPAVNASSLVYSMLQGEARAETFAAPSQPMPQPQISRQVAAQVQQGMLTAMNNGATRLDLQLHPAELGAVAVTLIARNGEVTARLTSERSETADMLNRQIEAMRINLEQQGVKVDKIEVQLQNQRDNADGSFQNLGQHNARQEEDARRQELNRLRNLASLRNDRTNAAETDLAQSVHNMGQSARYAGQAVHIVA